MPDLGLIPDPGDTVDSTGKCAHTHSDTVTKTDLLQGTIVAGTGPTAQVQLQGRSLWGGHRQAALAARAGLRALQKQGLVEASKEIF